MSYELKYLKYKNKYLKLKEYLGGTQDELIILDTVKYIGLKEYFRKGLTKLTIGNSVKVIGNHAFSNNQLTILTIPNSVETIGETAFYNNKLIELTIGNSVKVIGNSAFKENQLTKLTIPNSVETIGYEAFYNNNLIELTIGNSVETIGEAAFSSNKLTELKIGNFVKTIANYAFYNNKLTDLTIPNSVKTIRDYAFSHNKLTTLIIGNSVETIRDHAFYHNLLTKVTIPDSVKTIGNYAFSHNPLTEIITYNIEFNTKDKIHLITGIKKEKIIIDTESQTAPYTILIREDLYIPYITGYGLSIDIKYTIEDDKRINNFIDQLYTNTEFKQLIDYDENKSLYIILTKIITKSNGHTEEIRDPAIDAGGVTSFMFNNLLDDLTKGPDPYFISIDNYYILNNRILLHKSSEEKTELKKKIEFIGRLFAYALQLKQTIDIDLHPLLLYKMLFGIDALIDENHINYLIGNFDLDRRESPFGCFIEPIVPACKWDSDSEDGLELTDIEIIKKNALERIKTSESYNNEILDSFVTGFRTKIGFNDKKYKYITLVSTLSELISGKNKMWSINELIENLVFDGIVDQSSKDKFLTIIKSVITDELIKEGELKKGESMKIAMYNETENKTIKLWISLFIKLLTNRKKISHDGFKDKKLTISVINLPSLIDRPYIVHTCSHTIDIYMNDIEKLDKSLLYDGLKINFMKDQADDIGLR